MKRKPIDFRQWVVYKSDGYSGRTKKAVRGNYRVSFLKISKYEEELKIGNREWKTGKKPPLISCSENKNRRKKE